MYYDFFGFREPPFSIAPDPRYLYLSERHKETLAHLMYGVQGQGGFIVITGEVGTGKTTVSRCFIENIPAHVDIALILNPRLSARELLSAICDELEIPHGIGASIKELVDLINQDLLKAHAAGRHKVLMIDEAQNLSADVLEQLRLLTNLETAEKKLLQIVLLGQPELQDILTLPELRQLNQRVTARYHLDAISKNELAAYLRYRLSVAGLRGDIFSPRATQLLYRESQGIPRLINLISDRALLGAYADGEHEITASHIRQAAREVRGNGVARTRAGKRVGRRQQLVLVALSVLVAVVSTVWLIERWPESYRVQADTSGIAITTGVVERNSRSAEKEGPDQTVRNPEPEPESRNTFDFRAQSTDLRTAFESLFEVWGFDYQPARNPMACNYAQSNGLACLERQGSRRSLEFLNRPAILQLQDSQGRDGYVALRRLDGDQAQVILPNGDVEVSFATIEPFWYGDYRVLWQLPEYWTANNPYTGDTGEQLWLGARMMELADKLSDSRADSLAVKRMTTDEQVRWYQERKGLTVDGIAGAMTIIQIHNDLEAIFPRLVPPVSPEGQ